MAMETILPCKHASKNAVKETDTLQEMRKALCIFNLNPSFPSRSTESLPSQLCEAGEEDIGTCPRPPSELCS